MEHVDYVIYCAICGTKKTINIIKGNDNRFYIELCGTWIRIKKLDLFFIACNECILRENILEETK